MDYNIKYQTSFNSITDVMKTHAEEVIKKNVEVKMKSFWKKYLQHPDAEALIKIDIESSKDWRYTWGININVPGWPHLPYAREHYNSIADLINNGFAKYKESLGSAAK